MKKEELKWRLEKLPTVNELSVLIEKKIITPEEAKEVLFTQEKKEDRDKKSLKEEIRFLKKLVERLSENRTNIIQTIEKIQPTYIDKRWYEPYHHWYIASTSDNTSNGTFMCQTSTGELASYQIGNFSQIKTF